MQGRHRLELCRASLKAIRTQQEDVAQLMELTPQSPEEAMAIEAQLKRSRAVLADMRRQYPARLSMAMQTLTGLEGIEYKIMWSYYVLGLSNAEVSARLRYDYREVIRRKTAALAKLDEREQSA